MFEPVTDLEDLNNLCMDDMQDGYFKAREGYMLTGKETRAFVHGWRNGIADTSPDGPDNAQRELARKYVNQVKNGLA